MYAGRTRSGFTPASRDQLFKCFKTLAAETCPFANLPEAKSGRWGVGLTAEKMKDCRWLAPSLVGQFEFVEWTPDGHLRHSRFMDLRDDMEPEDGPGTMRLFWRRAGRQPPRTVAHVASGCTIRIYC